MKNIVICVAIMLLGAFAVSLATVSADYAPISADNVVIDKPIQGPASDVGWVTKAAHPTTRAHCMVSPCLDVGGVQKYYVFGGPTVSGGAYTNANYEYNTVTDAWTAKTAMPTARGIGRAALVRGKIYVLGGCSTYPTGLTTVEIYDPATDAWTTGTAMPTARLDFGVGVYKDTWIYACGGGQWSSTLLSSVDVFNTVTNTWSTATAMSTPMGTPGCGVIGNKIIMATGYVGAAGSNMVQVGTISPTDPTSITWTTGLAKPGGVVYRANSGVCNGQLYVIGGNLASGISNEAYKYDPTGNTWTTLPTKPTALSNCYGLGVKSTGQLYYPCGYTGSAYVSTHEMLDDASYTTDVGVAAIVAPGGLHSPNTLMSPIARVKNYGSASVGSFSVVCSIVGAGSVVRYTDTKAITSLAAGDTARVNFTSWTPTISENVTVIVRSNLAGDQNTGNDRMTQTTVIANLLLYEGFNDITFPPTGWQAVILSGTYNWIRATAGTSPTCTPYEGASMAEYESYSASAGGGARLISPAMNVPTARPCSLKFWMYHDPGYPGDLGPDSVRVLTSTNGTTFTQVASFRRYEAVAAWTEHAVYLGVMTGNFYIAFESYSEYGDNIFIDYARVAGATGIEEGSNNQTPIVTYLNAARPNPVTNGLAHISFSIAEPTKASLKIYDASGRLIRTLMNNKLNVGNYNLSWNGTDDHNNNVAEGIYFYTLTTDNNNYTKKLVFTR